MSWQYLVDLTSTDSVNLYGRRKTNLAQVSDKRKEHEGGERVRAKDRLCGVKMDREQQQCDCVNNNNVELYAP